MSAPASDASVAGSPPERISGEGPAGRNNQTPVTDDDLYSLPEGTVLWKPEYGGWSLFIREGGFWRCVDAYDRSARGCRYSAGAIGTHTPGYVIHQPPPLGYYAPPADDASVATS